MGGYVRYRQIGREVNWGELFWPGHVKIGREQFRCPSDLSGVLRSVCAPIAPTSSSAR